MWRLNLGKKKCMTQDTWLFFDRHGKLTVTFLLVCDQSKPSCIKIFFVMDIFFFLKLSLAANMWVPSVRSMQPLPQNKRRCHACREIPCKQEPVVRSIWWSRNPWRMYRRRRHHHMGFVLGTGLPVTRRGLARALPTLSI